MSKIGGRHPLFRNGAIGTWSSGWAVRVRTARPYRRLQGSILMRSGIEGRRLHEAGRRAGLLKGWRQLPNSTLRTSTTANSPTWSTRSSTTSRSSKPAPRPRRPGTGPRHLRAAETGRAVSLPLPRGGDHRHPPDMSGRRWPPLVDLALPDARKDLLDEPVNEEGRNG